MKISLPHRIALAIVSDYMETGYLKAGDRLPPVRALERRYGVSRNTVLHALSLLEQQGYVYRKHGAGVFVQTVSSAPAPTVPLLGLAGPNIYADLMLRVYEGVEKVARLHQMHVVVGSTGNDYHLERWQVARMVELGCQAIILFPCTRTESQLRQDYLKSEFPNTPIVLVDTAYPEQGRPQVVFDNYRAGYEMTQLLLQEGHERIAFMDFARREDSWMHYSTRERYRGYLDALKMAGMTLMPEHHWVIWDKHFAVDDVRSEIEQFLRKWLTEVHPPTAVIAIEDAIAVQTVLIAQDMGIHVPEQLCVVGFDDLPVARLFRPAFPTTAPDFRRAGELAADLAVRLIRGERLSSLVYMLPVPIRRRGATLKHETTSGVVPAMTEQGNTPPLAGDHNSTSPGGVRNAST